MTAVMASWVSLLAVQATLSLAGRMDLHRRFGLASLVVGPLVLIMLITLTIVRQNAAFGTPAGPIVNNILFVQIRSILDVPAIFHLGRCVTRRTDPQMHMRMMLLATLSLLDAGIARMSWLPFNQFPLSYLTIHVYLLVLLVPPLLYDLIRLRRIHRAWVVGTRADAAVGRRYGVRLGVGLVGPNRTEAGGWGGVAVAGTRAAGPDECALRGLTSARCAARRARAARP